MIAVISVVLIFLAAVVAWRWEVVAWNRYLRGRSKSLDSLEDFGTDTVYVRRGGRWIPVNPTKRRGE